MIISRGIITIPIFQNIQTTPIEIKILTLPTKDKIRLGIAIKEMIKIINRTITDRNGVILIKKRMMITTIEIAIKILIKIDFLPRIKVISLIIKEIKKIKGLMVIIGVMVLIKEIQEINKDIKVILFKELFLNNNQEILQDRVKIDNFSIKIILISTIRCQKGIYSTKIINKVSKVIK